MTPSRTHHIEYNIICMYREPASQPLCVHYNNNNERFFIITKKKKKIIPSRFNKQNENQLLFRCCICVECSCHRLSRDSRDFNDRPAKISARVVHFTHTLSRVESLLRTHINASSMTHTHRVRIHLPIV